MSDLFAESHAPKASRRRQRLPEDWSPTPESRQFAIGLGLDPDTVAPMFRDYWAATGKAMLDWKAAWQVWCRREAQTRARTYPQKSLGSGVMAISPGEPWEQRLRGYRPGRFWSPMWGPRPESGQCQAPRELVEAWKRGQ